MIHLEVEEYCENCPEFEAEIDKNQYEADYDPITQTNKKVCDTAIMCEHHERCKEIFCYLNRQRGRKP